MVNNLHTLESTAREFWAIWIAADTCTDSEGRAALEELKKIGEFPGVEEMLRIIPASWAYAIFPPICSRCGESVEAVVIASDVEGDSSLQMCEDCVKDLLGMFAK